MSRPTLHIILHLILPFLIAIFFYRKQWKKAWALMMLSMLIDLDHLWAEPVYAANRCSLGFHPLHTVYAGGLYLAVTLFPKTRIVGLGLLVHLALDGLDCWLMSIESGSC